MAIYKYVSLFLSSYCFYFCSTFYLFLKQIEYSSVTKAHESLEIIQGMQR